MVFTSHLVKRVVDVIGIVDTSITTGEEKIKNQIKKMDGSLLPMVKENCTSPLTVQIEPETRASADKSFAPPQ